jgi:hypothetical protein
MTRLAELNETRDQVDAAFHALGRATAKLHFNPLYKGEGQTLGGLLFVDGPIFVINVANALIENERGDHGDNLFPDITVSGAELRAEQKLADAWLTMRNRLARLHKLADQTYVKLQGEALQKANAVVKQIEMTAALPMPPPRRHYHQDRRLAMLPALLVLLAYRQELQDRKATKKKLREKALPGNPGGSSPSSGPGNPGGSSPSGGPGNPGGSSPSGGPGNPESPSFTPPPASPRKRPAQASSAVRPSSGFQALFRKNTMEAYREEHARPPTPADRAGPDAGHPSVDAFAGTRMIR